jgi:hypothetical protein
LRISGTQAAKLELGFPGSQGLQRNRLGPDLRWIANADVVVAALALDDQVCCRRTIPGNRIRNPDKEPIAIDFLLAEEFVFVVQSLRQLCRTEADCRGPAFE